MIVIGLTGSIGMGKTTAARALARMGLPVHDSDAVVHRLFARGGAAVGPVGAAFPKAIKEGAVDRKLLGSQVFRDPAALARLEAIVHPLVRGESRRFLKRCALRRQPLAVLDVPLLFEVGREDSPNVNTIASVIVFVVIRQIGERDVDGGRVTRIAEARFPFGREG